MSAEKFAFAVAVAVFAGGAVGLILQRALHERFTTGGPRDMIGAVVGLLTLLSALVLGLLIWTAYGVFAGQNVAIQTLAAKVLQLDLALADYGPEAKDARMRVRQDLGKTIDEIWGSNQSDADFVANNFAEAIKNLRNREGTLAALHPATDAQTQALAAQRRRQMRSASRDCRCPSRWPVPSPIRSLSQWSPGRCFFLAATA